MKMCVKIVALPSVFYYNGSIEQQRNLNTTYARHSLLFNILGVVIVTTSTRFIELLASLMVASETENSEVAKGMIEESIARAQNILQSAQEYLQAGSQLTTA